MFLNSATNVLKLLIPANLTILTNNQLRRIWTTQMARPFLVKILTICLRTAIFLSQYINEFNNGYLILGKSINVSL